MKRPICGLRLGVLVLCTTTLFCLGCASTIRITNTVPSPVVEALPLKVGLYYDEALLKYIHQEYDISGSYWVIELGPGHEQLFDQVFASLFGRVTRIDDSALSAETPADFDIIIEPRIETYTLHTPYYSGSEFYQVWILYSINLYSAQGKLLASWEVEGYGKSRSHWNQFTNRAVGKATALAMRDAAAQMAIETTDNLELQQVLYAEQTKTATTVDDSVQ